MSDVKALRLTRAQQRLLLDARRDGFVDVIARYEPAIRLVDAGLATMVPRGFSSARLKLTAAGRLLADGGRP